jgi:hypothetical protein
MTGVDEVEAPVRKYDLFPRGAQNGQEGAKFFNGFYFIRHTNIIARLFVIPAKAGIHPRFNHSRTSFDGDLIKANGYLLSQV